MSLETIGGLLAVVLIVAVIVLLVRFPQGQSARVPDDDDDDRAVLAATAKIVGAVLMMAAIGVATMVLVRWGVPDNAAEIAGPFGARLGVDILAGISAGAVGGLVGFVFGIPRTVTVPVSNGSERPAEAAHPGLGVNTNLERVSDWLATLLLGATLVQVEKIPGWLAKAATILSASPGIAVLILGPIYFFVLGFLGVYLVTRLYLTTALASPMRNMIGAAGISRRQAVNIMLVKALKSTDPKDYENALTFSDNSNLTPEESVDPALNSNLVRLMAKTIKLGKPDNMTTRLNDLRQAATKAAVDPNVKSALRAELADKTLTTGIADQDTTLLKIVS